MTTLGDLYDAEDLARIEAGPRPSPPRGRNHPAAAGALVVALGLGLAEVLDPEPERPVVTDVDPSDPWRDLPIRIVGMELGPRHTVAVVAAR